MSRIGKIPIKIPKGVNINYDGSEINVQGNFGELKMSIPEVIEIIQNDKILNVNLKVNNRNVKALHGLYRTLINNMIVGVSEQFQITLMLKGVGYRAVVQGNEIVLNLGYSHQVKIKIPKLINIDIVQNTNINLK